jgi:heat shock protein HslJ
VVALVVAVLTVSSASFARASPSGDLLQSTTWRWVHSNTDQDGFTAPVDRNRYAVQFGADGTLGVRADCNQVGGTYRKTGRRLSLELGPSTLAACPPDSQADVFLQQLGGVVSFDATEAVLVLNMRLGSGTMILEPQPVLSLTETNWQVHSYNNGVGGGLAAVTSPVPDTELTAVFGDDGTVEGSAGCNSYSGKYSVDGTSMSIGALVTTRRACPEPVMVQEQAFLTALQASTQYELTADRLTLRDDDGAIQVDLLPAVPQ